MLPSKRGKKLAVLSVDRPARCVSPRLRPCCANRCSPKISDRMGGCTGPRDPSSISRSASCAPGARCRNSAWAMPYESIEAAAPNNNVAITSVVTKRAETKPFMLSAKHRSANRRPCAPLQLFRCSPSADSSIGDVSAVPPKEEVVHEGLATAWAFMEISANAAEMPQTMAPAKKIRDSGRDTQAGVPGINCKGMRADYEIVIFLTHRYKAGLLCKFSYSTR